MQFLNIDMVESYPGKGNLRVATIELSDISSIENVLY